MHLHLRQIFKQKVDSSHEGIHFFAVKLIFQAKTCHFD